MAQETIDKIINIQFNYGELVQGWQKTTREIEINKKNLAELKQEYKNGEMSASEYNRALLEITSTTKALNAEKKAYEKEIQSNIKIETQEVGSLNQLRASLQKMTAQYNAMSAARREGQEGLSLAAAIKSQQEAVTEAEKALGNYRSQVGSYEEAIRAVLPAEMSQVVTLGKTIDKAGGVTKAFGLMTAAVGRMIKAALAFVATPLGAVLTALAVGAALVVKNWGKLTDALGITSPAREAAKAIEKLNEQLDYFNNRAEKNGTEALKRYTEALKNAKGDAEALAKAQRDYNIELLNAEYERARIAKAAADKAEAKAYAAYQRDWKNEKVAKALQEAKDAVQKADADFAQADHERTKFHADALAKQVEDEKKAAEERAKIRYEAAMRESKEYKERAQLEEQLQRARQDMIHQTYALQAELEDAAKDFDKEWLDEMERMMDRRSREYQNRLTEATLSGGSLGAAKETIAIAKEQLAQLDDIASNEELINRLGWDDVELQRQRLDLRMQIANAEQSIAQEQDRTAQEAARQTAQTLGGLSSMTGAFSAMFEALGGEGERYAEFAKTLAVFQVMLAQAQAIANAVAAGSQAPWFMLPITIASSIAAVVAAIAQATQITDSAQTPKYASGGLVTGPGTGTSDSIPAMLSNGEAVMTAQAVNDWGAMLSAMNVASGGNAIQVSNLPQRNDGMKGMERMMERVLMNMPAPIVSVVDINKGQKRVKVQNSLGKLGRKKYE